MKERTARETAYRIETLFVYATNRDSIFPDLLRAASNHYRAPWWAQAADRIACFYWTDAWRKSAEPAVHWTDAPTAAEVLALAVRLETHFRASVAREGASPV